MDSFFKSASLVLALIVSSAIIFSCIEYFFPLLNNKWYFAFGILFGVFGVFFTQIKYKIYENEEK